MKKIIMLILLLAFICAGYCIVNNKGEKNYKILYDTEAENAIINDYYIYGNHLNIEGSLNIDDASVDINDISLVLKNNSREYIIDMLFEKNDKVITFKSSDYINDGINLDILPLGNWYLFIKIDSQGEYKYYNLVNNTSYNNLKYYTITKNNSNNLIEMNFEEKEINSKKINYVSFDIIKTELPDDVYDISIDPGHGGVDSGAVNKLDGVTYTESDLTLEIAVKLKKKLEKAGYKVLLTRNSDVDLDFYNDKGRAVVPNKYHSKLSISLHLNSDSSKMNYGGVEVYVPNDSKLDFAKSLATNIATDAKIGFSKKKFNKIEEGVYFNYFKESDILEVNQNYIDKGIKKYDIEVGAPEMCMIREVGGKVTHAYVDGRNEKYGLNPYYNSNQTAEGYLVELAYISYEDNLKKIINDSDSFVSAIGKTIVNYYN